MASASRRWTHAVSVRKNQRAAVGSITPARVAEGALPTRFGRILGYYGTTGLSLEDRATTMNAGSVIMPEGRRLFAGSSGTGAPEDKDK